VVTAREFTIEEVSLRDFPSEALRIDNASSWERHYKVASVDIAQGQKGGVFYLKGKGKMNFDLIDSKFHNLFEGFELTGEAEGNYNVINNEYQNIWEAGGKLTLGGGAGNLAVNYERNRHYENKDGTLVEEIQHTGEIVWNLEKNLWQNGTDGLTANFRVAGGKNFLNNTAQINAGIGLNLKFNPFLGNTITASLNGEVLKDNGTGVQYLVLGKVEIIQRLFTLSENKNAGIDLVANADAQGKWMDNNSNYIANFGIGVRLVNLGGAFDFGIFKDLIKDNYNIGIFSIGFKFSGTVQNSAITNNIYGVRLTDSTVTLSHNSICFNSIDGVLIEGDSQISLYHNILDQNGEHEVNNNSPNYVRAIYNDWGPENTIEMQMLPFPSDIMKIYDSFDNPASGFVDYNEWIRYGLP